MSVERIHLEVREVYNMKVRLFLHFFYGCSPAFNRQIVVNARRLDAEIRSKTRVTGDGLQHALVQERPVDEPDALRGERHVGLKLRGDRVARDLSVLARLYVLAGLVVGITCVNIARVGLVLVEIKERGHIILREDQAVIARSGCLGCLRPGLCVLDGTLYLVAQSLSVQAAVAEILVGLHIAGRLALYHKLARNAAFAVTCVDPL